MNMDPGNWLTLAEVIRQGDLDDIEARRLVNELGELLAPRNFGDIVKYPAPVADLLARLTNLRRQGWTYADLKNLLIMTRRETQEGYQARRSNLLAELKLESTILLGNLELVLDFGSRMQEALKAVACLMSSFDSLIMKMLDQEKEVSELRSKGNLGKFPCGAADL
jgi:hypothetical protein